METIPLGLKLGKSEEKPGETGFTSEDYSDYSPEEAKKDEVKKEETVSKDEALLEQNVDNEDKLYDE